MNNGTLFFWTEPELLDKKTWLIMKVMRGSGNVMKRMTFKSKQDALVELRRISIKVEVKNRKERRAHMQDE